MKDFIRVDGQGLDPADAYRLVVGCVVPRPVAWITTQDRSGRVNAAPFSSYNYVATRPPMLAVNISTLDGDLKDTARNIIETREFVVNVSTEADLEIMHASAAEYPPEISEPEALGIPLLPSHHVKPPRIASTPVQMECRLDQAIELGRATTPCTSARSLPSTSLPTSTTADASTAPPCGPSPAWGGLSMPRWGKSSTGRCCNGSRARNRRPSAERRADVGGVSG